MNSKIKQAMVVMADRIRNGQVADVDDAVLEAYESAEAYVQAAVDAKKDLDRRGVQRNLRDAMRHGAGQQLSLPGMDHAALPAVVFRTYPDDTFEVVPWQRATKGEMKDEVRRMRRSVAAQDAVVSGYEASLRWLDDHGIGDDVLGDEIVEQFGRQIEP